MIPKIIHQTGPSNKDDWHPIWEECQNSWKQNFPDFEYVFWTDDDLRSLIETNYSEVLEYYDQFPYHIIRVDFARFCILHSYGGIYSDLDRYCYKNFYNYLTEDLYLVESWPAWDEKVQNSLMISNKSNKFWIKCIRKCIETYLCKDIEKYSDIDDCVLNIAGPKLISKIIDDTIGILPRQIFNPEIKTQFNWSWKNYQSEKYFKALSEFNESNILNDDIITRHYLTGCWPGLPDE